MTYSLPSCSRISCCRVGHLSMERVISRTVQGAGLRSLTSPSLSISASMKPRGRSFLRRAERSLGAVSSRITTSRSSSSSMSDSRNRSCSTNRGSASASAKTTIGRLTQRNSSSVTSALSTRGSTGVSAASVSGSVTTSVTGSGAVSAAAASCAANEVPPNTGSAKNVRIPNTRRIKARPPVVQDIGILGPIATVNCTNLGVPLSDCLRQLAPFPLSPTKDAPPGAKKRTKA